MNNISRISLVLIYTILIFWGNIATAQSQQTGSKPERLEAPAVLHGPVVPRTKLILRVESITSPTEAEAAFDPHSASPIVLKFDLRGHIEGNYDCPTVATRPWPRANSKISLIDLEYRLYDENNHLFFADKIDLYGLITPGSLVVKPGVAVPEGANRIKVTAKASYKFTQYAVSGCDVAGHGIDSAATEKLSDPIQAHTFLRYANLRDGILRRHILNSGRVLEGLWLKEYEPLRDRPELLYHSRTIKAPNDHARVYIPWVRACGCDKSQFDTEEACVVTNGGHWENCGESVSSNALTVYTGGENPLLRGGLAMAGLAREMKIHYLRENDDMAKYLKGYALKILEFFEKSEYVDPFGNRTGFFLRSNYPGHGGLTDREYFYASTDEIIGMTLGLFYLHNSLHTMRDTVNENRVEQLVDRLGTNLKQNYFFIVPHRYGGLPRERHKGWSGTYFFQWYLAGAFRAITGQGYRPPDPQLDESHEFWREVRDWPFRGGDDDKRGVEALLRMGLSSHERAVYAIQGLGWQMYWGGHTYDFAGLNFDIPKFNRWNFPMLIHAFRLGMADTSRGTNQINRIKWEISRLVNGVLRQGGAYSRFDVGRVLKAYIGGYVGHWFDHWPSFGDEITEHVGTRDAEHDFYAAKVAQLYGLENMYEQEDKKQQFVQAITAASAINMVDATGHEYAPGLPVGERSIHWCVGGDKNGRECDNSVANCPPETTGLSAPSTSTRNYNVCWTQSSGGQRRAYLLETAEGGVQTTYTVTGANSKSFSKGPGTYSYRLKLCFREPGIDREMCEPLSGAVAVVVTGPCPGGGSCQAFPVVTHNPYDKIGKVFMWEQVPTWRVLNGGDDGNAGLGNQDIIDLYLRGLNEAEGDVDGYDAVIEGAGLGYFHPIATLTGGETFSYTVGDPQIPYLGLCSSAPRLVAEIEQQRTNATASICRFSYPTDLTPDAYDTGIRNDSYDNASSIGIGQYHSLNLDKTTHPAYRNIEYAKYTSSSDQSIQFIPLVSDYDYYRVSNHDERELEVEILSPVTRGTVLITRDSGRIQFVPEAVQITSGRSLLTHELSLPWAGVHATLELRVNSATGEIDVFINGESVSWNPLTNGIALTHQFQEDRDIEIRILFLSNIRAIVDEQVINQKSWRVETSTFERQRGSHIGPNWQLFNSKSIAIDGKPEHTILVAGEQGKYNLNIITR